MFGRSIPIFCYHNVSPADGHTPELFESHLDAMLDAGYSTMGAAELLDVCQGKRPLKGRRVVLTFDDGHLSNWLLAAPAMARRGMTGIFFCLSDFIGQGPARGLEAAADLRSLPDSFRSALDGDLSQFMNEAELKALAAMGMDVQSHGRSHRSCFRALTPLGIPPHKIHWSVRGIYGGDFEGLPVFEIGSAYVYNGFWPQRDAGGLCFRARGPVERRAFCQQDFRSCLERIRAINGGGPQFFCWPWGQFDALALEELRRAGYQGAFTLERWSNGPGTDPFRLNRLGVGKAKSPAWVRARLAMYGSSAGARLFFKFQRKAFEPATVLLATDSTKLSGGSRQMINNAKALGELGLRVLAAVPAESPLAPALKKAGARVLAFDGFRSPWAAAGFLRDIAAKEAVDVVHAFHTKAYKGGILARLMGARFRLFVNRGVIFPPNPLFGLFARLTSGVICNSLQCVRVLQRYGVPASKCSVVYNSYAPGGGTPAPPQPRPKRGVRVAWVGNEAQAKGFDTMLHAVALLHDTGRAKDMEFVLCGTRPRSAMAGLAAPAVLDRIHFTGTVPHCEVLRLLDESDILCISSRQESLPNVMLEAFMAGLPVVATAAGGIPELVRDGVNGRIVPCEDAEGLARALRSLADDPAERLRMGRINYALASEHLDNGAKGRNLVRVYGGERLFEPLPLERIAAAVPHDAVEDVPRGERR